MLLSVSLVFGAVAQVSGNVASPLKPTNHPRDFSIHVDPSFLSIPSGGNAQATVTLTSIGQFSGAITLSATIVPATNSTPGLTLVPLTVRLRTGSSVNSTLSITTSSGTGPGGYNVTVLAQGSKISRSALVNVFVIPPPDFSLTLQPSFESVPLGSSQSSSYILQSLNGFSGSVTITPSNIPAGVGVGIETPPPLGSGATFTGGLFLNADNNAVPGTYSIIFTGQSGSIIRTARLSVTIFPSPPDFTFTTHPSFLNVSQGSTGLVLVDLTSIGGFNGTVSLTSGVIPVISGGPATSLNQSSVTLIANRSRAVELRIITTSTTSTGFYNYTVTGTSGSLSHTVVGSFTITNSSRPPPGFSISASTTFLTIPQGSSDRVFLNLTSLNGFAGTINLMAMVSPAGPRLVLGGNSVTLNPGGTTQVVLAVFANTTVPVPPGNYLIMATGTGGNLTHSVNIQLTVTSTSASLFLVSFVFQPENVSLQLHNQGGGSISLNLYQASDGSHDNWTRTGWPGPTLIPNATVFTVIMIAADCPSCVYTGVAGAFTQFTPGNTYIITVVSSNGQAFTFSLAYSSAHEGLLLDGYSFFSGTNVTLILGNIGNVSVSLVSYYVVDALGNQYALTTWSGPTIAPGASFPAQILIGASCPNCTLTGSPFTFTPGQSYRILIVTSRNNQFTFTVTR